MSSASRPLAKASLTSTRAALAFQGRMPVTRHLPVSWYETQNIHHVTVADFRELIAAKGVRCERAWYFAGDRAIGAAAANLRAEYALFELSR